MDKKAEAVMRMVTELLAMCRKVADTYLNKTTNSPGSYQYDAATCDYYRVGLNNYITLLNKIINLNPKEGSAKEREQWVRVLTPHIDKIANDDMSFLADDSKVVIVKRDPPNSKSIYEVNLTKIYKMANDMSILTDSSHAVSDMRRGLIACIVNLVFMIFEDRRMTLQGMKNKYAPNMSHNKIINKLGEVVPSILESHAPNSSLDMSKLTSTIQGLMPKQGESPEESESRLMNAVSLNTISPLIEEIVKPHT